MGLLRALILPALIFTSTIATFEDVPEYKAIITSTGEEYDGPDIRDPAVIFNKTEYYPNIYYGEQVGVVNADIENGRVFLSINSYLSQITEVYRLAKTEVSAKWMYIDFLVYSDTVDGVVTLSTANRYEGVIGDDVTVMRHFMIEDESRMVKVANQELKQEVHDYYPLILNVKDYSRYVDEMLPIFPNNKRVMNFDIPTENKDALDYFYVPRITFFEEASWINSLVWYHEANIWLYFVEAFAGLAIVVGIAYGVSVANSRKKKPEIRTVKKRRMK